MRSASARSPCSSAQTNASMGSRNGPCPTSSNRTPGSLARMSGSAASPDCTPLAEINRPTYSSTASCSQSICWSFSSTSSSGAFVSYLTLVSATRSDSVSVAARTRSSISSSWPGRRPRGNSDSALQSRPIFSRRRSRGTGANWAVCTPSGSTLNFSSRSVTAGRIVATRDRISSPCTKIWPASEKALVAYA